jgi:exosome complex component RRP42
MTNAEFTPIAHPTFEPGPPDERSIELARVVDRGLRSAEILDLKKLCLVNGKKVLMVYVDIYVLSYDGNLIDCSAMAAIAALKTAKMPVYTVKDETVTLTKKTKAVKLNKEPLAVSIVKIGDSLLVDPSADEEEVMDARITVSLDEKGNVCTIQKTGSVGFTREELRNVVQIAAEKVEELRKNI